MQSNNHRILAEIESSRVWSVAHTVLDQLKDYAISINRNPRHIRILNKKQLTTKNVRHVDCQIDWPDGPDDWALTLPLQDITGVYMEAHTGNTLSFYAI